MSFLLAVTRGDCERDGCCRVLLLPSAHVSEEGRSYTVTDKELDPDKCARGISSELVLLRFFFVEAQKAPATGSVGTMRFVRKAPYLARYLPSTHHGWLLAVPYSTAVTSTLSTSPMARLGGATFKITHHSCGCDDDFGRPIVLVLNSSRPGLHERSRRLVGVCSALPYSGEANGACRVAYNRCTIEPSICTFNRRRCCETAGEKFCELAGRNPRVE